MNRLTSYLHSLYPGDSAFLEEVRKRALADRVPIIRRETGEFLKTMTAAAKPSRILEVGTGVGYSALLMASVMPRDCRIITIEKYEKRIPAARQNIRLAGEEERITLLPGDAGEILPGLAGPFDLIFMDAAKGQYIHWLPVLLERMPEGGILFSDNVLQEGDILESRFAVERRNRTIHTRMREYLYALTHTEGLVTSILPLGDGVALSVRGKARGEEPV